MGVELSVVLPCFDEAGALPALLEELDAVLGALAVKGEIVVVDDGSTDDSIAVLAALQAHHRRLRVLRHAANIGQSAALATGVRHARGAVVVTMDSDGQADPADIPRLLAVLGEGHDAVCGVRARRLDGWVRRASSRIANAFRNAVTGDSISDAGCTYRALRRAVLDELPVFNGMHRFLPSMLRAQGYDVVEHPVSHRPRTTGRSKYGIGNRLWRGFADCLAMCWWRRRAVPGRRLAAPPSPVEEASDAGRRGRRVTLDRPRRPMTELVD